MTIQVGAARLTRVLYADIGVMPETVGLTAEQVAAVSWAEPQWATGGEVLAAAAVWIVESGDARIAVDPALAADPILRNRDDAAFHQEAFAGLLDDAGFPRESITHAIATHIEGVGMFGWRDSDAWTPFFPNAPLLVAERELAFMDTGAPVDYEGAIAQLRAQGVVRGVADGEQVTDEVHLEHSGGHSPGHQLVHVDSNGASAVMVGHLAVSPLHFGTGECPQQHMDPARTEAVLERLRGTDALLVGPLWPSPGAGSWDGARLVPV